ncbi:alpha/beta hydrolase family protein [Kocuria tytonis]|uniref:Serine aminopeptidase S33 domain-containing protein n=1 Tax=Kocuria tytonis TaxID=2054280 RepID=A0A495A3K0_9MICC|nr:hypothetical protein [Kocuria tytonis]RKQ34170.1 hypothetical protein C1C97_010055 [Kocuria tytonis]
MITDTHTSVPRAARGGDVPGAAPAPSDRGPAGIHGAGMWTGSGDTATVTWLHTPENGRVRALVVLAPPVGPDHTRSYRELRQLAMMLAGAGYCVARVNYRGTGDSHGLRPDDDVAALWERNVRDAVTQARAVCGIADAPVYGIGHRVGTALLLRAVECFDRVIAWEPESGAEFLRRWSRPRAVDPRDVPPEHGVDLPGLWLTAAQAAQLRALPGPAPDVDRPDADRPDAVQVLGWTARGAGPASRGNASEYPVGAASSSAPRHGTARRLPGRHTPGAPVPHEQAPRGCDPRTRNPLTDLQDEEPVRYDVLEDLLWALPRPRLVPFTGVGRGPARNEFVADSGHACVEELVAVGWRGHCGVLSGPATALPGTDDGSGNRAAAPDGPAVVLVAGGCGARDASGLWPPVARRLAGRGVVTLRADGDGAGDRVPPWQERIPDPRQAGSARAVRHQLRWLAERHPGPVVLVAAGEGIPTARRVADATDGAPVDGVVLVGSWQRAPGRRPGAAARRVLNAARGLRPRTGGPSRAPRQHRVDVGDAQALSRAARERTARELEALLGNRS